MPLGFEHVPGEVAVYAEPGDVLLHDAYLWHAAARGTDDSARRRHVRGHWCTGAPLRDDDIDDFVKNAAKVGALAISAIIRRHATDSRSARVWTSTRGSRCSSMRS